MPGISQEVLDMEHEAIGSILNKIETSSKLTKGSRRSEVLLAFHRGRQVGFEEPHTCSKCGHVDKD